MPEANSDAGDIVSLHAKVDREAARLAKRHRARLECKRGCSACCVDGLTVFEVEAERIRNAFPEVLRSSAHPAGACAFLDANGACRIYAARPYVCRTQGLPLVFFEEDHAEQIIETRSICELNAAGEALRELDLDDCWLIGPTELELQKMQAASSADQRRVALRDLFLV